MIMGEGGDQDQRKGKDKKKDDDDNQSLTGYSSQPGEEPSCLCASVQRKTWLVELPSNQSRTDVNPRFPNRNHLNLRFVEKTFQCKFNIT
jgi:hypothetical protein